MATQRINPPRDAVDITMRAIWRSRPEGLLQLATGDPNLRLLRTIEAEPVAIRRSVDAAALMEDDRGPVVIHIEFEVSGDQRALPGRAYVYAAQLYASLKQQYPIRSVVILLEDRLPRLEPVFVMRHGDEELCRYRFSLLRLADLPPAAFLDDPGRAALVSFSQQAAEADLVAARQLIEAESSGEERDDLLAALYIISGRRFARQRVRSLLWSQAVMESSTFQEILEMGFEHGVEQGIEKGISLSTERARRRLESQLRARFGELDEATRTRLAAADDEELDRWSLRLLRAARLADVFAE